MSGFTEKDEPGAVPGGRVRGGAGGAGAHVTRDQHSQCPKRLVITRYQLTYVYYLYRLLLINYYSYTKLNKYTAFRCFTFLFT